MTSAFTFLRAIMRCGLGLGLVALGPGLQAQPRHPDAILVSPASQAIAGVRAQPVTADPYPLLVAMHMFEIAEDTRSAQAVREYLRQVAVLRLAGLPVAVGGTVGDIVDGRTALPAFNDALATQVAETALTPRLAVSAPGDKLALGWNETRRRLAPGLWRTVSANGPAEVELFIEIENTSRVPVDGLFTELRVQPQNGSEPVELRCRGTEQAVPRRLLPGGRILQMCALHSSEVEQRLPALLPAVQAAQGDASRLRLLRAGFTFPSLSASVSTDGSVAVGRPAAYDEARARLEAMNCFSRGACMAELQRAVQRYMLLLVIAAGGIAFAFLFRLRPRVARPQAPTTPGETAAAPAARPMDAAGTERKSSPGRVGLVIFGAYLTFLAICVWFALADHPWKPGRRGLDGVVFYFASLAAGFPGSLVALQGGFKTDAAFAAFCWTSAVANVCLLGWACGLWWRRRPRDADDPPAGAAAS